MKKQLKTYSTPYNACKKCVLNNENCDVSCMLKGRNKKYYVAQQINNAYIGKREFSNALAKVKHK